MLPLRQRLVSILAIALTAPVCAEFLQAYLGLTGDAAELAAAAVFLAPLYGGAALLVRDLAVRTGRGWTRVLLLAAAFGLVMTGVIDLSMFAGDRPDVAYWAELREPTLVGPLGLSAYATFVWVLGHVTMSVGAPLAVHGALAPRHAGRPLLGWFGTALTALALLLVAVAVHLDGRDMYGYAPSVAQVVGPLVGVAALVALALSPLGRPVRRRVPGAGPRVPAWAIVAVGVLGKAVLDVVPPTWTGLTLTAAYVAVLCWWLRRIAAGRRWGAREIGVLGASLVVSTVLIGFLAPLPEGVTMTAKVGQNLVLLAAAVAVLVAVLRKSPRYDPALEAIPLPPRSGFGFRPST